MIRFPVTMETVQEAGPDGIYQHQPLETAPAGRPDTNNQHRNMNNTYNPKPIDISDVELPEDLRSLSEELAKNVHDKWAKQRIREGWTYGPQRDDVRKTHPDLVPYDELPESEKDYDRSSSMDTLKLIISRGYKITKTDA